MQAKPVGDRRPFRNGGGTTFVSVHLSTGTALPLAATIIIFVATKVLSRQIFLWRKKFCRDKHTFVAIKDVFCRDDHVFVATEVCLQWQLLSWQNCVCCDKHVFVATNIILSWQAYFCRDKRRVLSQQKWYLWQLPPMIEHQGQSPPWQGTRGVLWPVAVTSLGALLFCM